MIRKLTKADERSVLEYLYQEPDINIFIIGDIENYGFDTDFQEIYADIEDNAYQSVLLRYKINVIYYSHEVTFDAAWLPLIKSMTFDFISGKKSLTDLIYPHFSHFKEKDMYFASATDFDPSLRINDEGIIKVKTEDDCELTFNLLKQIDEFDGMKKQEKRDFIDSKMASLKHSVSYYIKENNKCVSTVSTVADTSKSAMVVAVATDPLYRQKGYASKLMIYLLDEYINKRNKSLALFFDNPKAGVIYHRLGFKDLDKWVMLVRKEG